MAPTKTQTVHSKIYWLFIVISVILGLPVANTKQDKPLLIRLTCGGGRSPRGAHSGWIGIGLRVIIVA